MRHALAVAALVLAVTRATWAQAPAVGSCAGVTLLQNGAQIGCLELLDLGASGFAAPVCQGNKCTVNLASSVTMLGSCLGAAAGWCGTVDWSGKILDASAATSLRVPVGTGAGPTANAQLRVNDTYDDLEVGNGTVATVFRPGLPRTKLGGTGIDGAFSYAGEGAGACSGDVCRGGICTGTTPTGTCTLTANSMLGRALSDVAAADTDVPTAVVGNYTLFSWTAGNLTIATTNPSLNGRDVVLRATDNIGFAGTGTLNLRGLGAAGGTGGASSSAAGKSSGATMLFQRTGATGAGKAGFNAPDLTRLFFWVPGLFTLRGTGGGAGAGATTAGTSLDGLGWPTLGATGGTGGGCTSTGVTVGGGGAGGGFLLIETAQLFVCSGVKVDLRGADGGTASGGGGGGGLVVLARGFFGAPCPIDTAATCPTAGRACTAGGAGGASSGVCSAGGAGGNGAVLYAAVPQ